MLRRSRRGRSLIQRFVSIISTIALLLILGLVALSQYDVGPFRMIVVRSGSMTPALQPGDLVIVSVTDAAREDVHVDDIILFEDPAGRPTLHRVIATSSEGLLTQGDANEDPDPWQVERVDGVKVASVPWVGYGLQYLQDGLRVIAMAFR